MENVSEDERSSGRGSDTDGAESDRSEAWFELQHVQLDSDSDGERGWTEEEVVDEEVSEDLAKEVPGGKIRE